MCGEKPLCVAGCVPQKGSPPRVRGKGERLYQDMERVGITPACAGKRRPRFAPPCAPLGSPPRVRGKVMDTSPLCRRSRITPACAGKSDSASVASSVLRDHPRVCGEKGKWAQSQTISAGSPPRVRGKVRHARIDCARFGITPACAGKSGCCNPDPQGQRDHPRVCGEKHEPARAQGLIMGSPPRVRGKGGSQRPNTGPPGITPACAGKS